MKKIDATYKKLLESQEQLEFAIAQIDKQLSPFIRFNFTILHQTDGFVVLHEEESDVALLKSCINIIREKGRLSYEDYIKICI